MGFSQGFAAGFGMVDSAMHRREQTQMAQADREEANRRYQNQQERIKAQDIESQRQQQMQEAALGLDPNWNQEQKTQYVLGSARQDNFNKQRSALAELENSKATAQADLDYKKSQTELNRQKSNEVKNNVAAKNANTNDAKVDTVLQKVLAGTASADELEWLQKNEGSAGLVEQLEKRADVYQAFQSEYAVYNQRYEDAIRNKDQASADKILDELEEYINNDPKSIETMNSAFYQSLADRIQADDSIKSISFAGFDAVPGGLEPLLNIEYKDGTKKIKVPATRGKTANPDDELAIISIQDVKNRVANITNISGALRAWEARNQEARGIYGKTQNNNDKARVIGQGSALVDQNGRVLYENQRGSLTPNEAATLAAKYYAASTNEVNKERKEELIKMAQEYEAMAKQQTNSPSAQQINLELINRLGLIPAEQ